MIIADRIQYVARRRQPGTYQHTVVTADPAWLRSALSTGLTRPAAARTIRQSAMTGALRAS